MREEGTSPARSSNVLPAHLRGDSRNEVEGRRCRSRQSASAFGEAVGKPSIDPPPRSLSEPCASILVTRELSARSLCVGRHVDDCERAEEVIARLMVSPP